MKEKGWKDLTETERADAIKDFVELRYPRSELNFLKLAEKVLVSAKTKKGLAKPPRLVLPPYAGAGGSYSEDFRAIFRLLPLWHKGPLYPISRILMDTRPWCVIFICILCFRMA